MKAIIINNEIRYDEDTLTLEEIGYEVDEEVELRELCGEYMLAAKSDIVIDGTVAIYEGEEFAVSKDEIEVMA